VSECVRNRSAGLRWEGAYSTPRPPSWIYREDREKRGKRNRRAGNGIKKGEKGNGKGSVMREEQE